MTKAQKTIERIQNLENKYQRNSTRIRHAHEIAEKFNNSQEEFQILINANTESHLDLTSAWLPAQVFRNGIAYQDFRF